jgi:formylglycine-generating enzyme required for sulfatase activity
MKPADIKRALEIVEDALGLSGDELDSYLDTVCGEDSLLRREVLGYLAYDVEHTVLSAGSNSGSAPAIPSATTAESRYDLGDEIARGGMGVVLRAFDNNLRRDVAVKVLKEEAENNPDIVHRFLQEAQIGGQLQHPGIAPVYEIGRLPDRRPFIAMKLVNGSTLEELLTCRRDTTDDQSHFLGILEQVCQAMAFAHRRGVIHRDLKPANVMVGEFGEVQVMDWGIAKLVSDNQPEEPESEGLSHTDVLASDPVKVDTDGNGHHTRVGQLMGSPAYMAPEQSIGRADRTADVFSLGAILCEILTGEKTAGGLDAAVARLDRCPCDPDLAKLAKDCLQRNEADRPQDAGVVAARISAHFGALESRLQEARMATARAEVKADEERRRRLRTLGTVTVAVIVLVLVALAVWIIRNSMIARQNATTAELLVDSLPNTETAQVPAVLSDLAEVRRWADPLLQREIAGVADGSTAKLHFSLALLPVDESQVDYLVRQLPLCTLEQFPLVHEAISPHRDRFIDALWDLAVHGEDDAQRFQAAVSLADFTPDDSRWIDAAPFVAEHLTTTVAAAQLDPWTDRLRSGGHQLVDPLIEIHADRSRPDQQRAVAASILAAYLQHEPARLAEILTFADDIAQYAPLLEALRSHAAEAKPKLIELQTPRFRNRKAGEGLFREMHRCTLASVTLVHLGHGKEVWPHLKSIDWPWVRRFLIENLGRYRVAGSQLAAQLEQESEVSIRRALIKSLGGLDASSIPAEDRIRISRQLQELFVNDPDPGVHSAASWTLRQWGETLPELPTGEAAYLERRQRSTSQIVTAKPELGGLGTGWYVRASPKHTYSQLGYEFAISTHEVTRREFAAFTGSPSRNSTFPDENHPVRLVSWYDAVNYCNWLSQEEKIPQDQWVYEPNAAGEFAEGMKIKEDYLQLRGYRLPTRGEWRYALFAGIGEKSLVFEPDSLVPRYGNFILSSQGQVLPVESLLPNEVGLFDTRGNVAEWVQDPPSGPLSPIDNQSLRAFRGGAYDDPPKIRIHQHPAGGRRDAGAPYFTRQSEAPFARVLTIGFRVARTHR